MAPPSSTRPRAGWDRAADLLAGGYVVLYGPAGLGLLAWWSRAELGSWRVAAADVLAFAVGLCVLGGAVWAAPPAWKAPAIPGVRGPLLVLPAALVAAALGGAMARGGAVLTGGRPGAAAVAAARAAAWALNVGLVPALGWALERWLVRRRAA